MGPYYIRARSLQPCADHLGAMPDPGDDAGRGRRVAANVMAILTQYPSASLILFALVFVVLEGVLPHRPVDRRREWPLDLLAVAAGVVFVVVAYGGLRHLIPVLDALAPSTVLRALRTLPSAAKVVLVVLLVDFTIAHPFGGLCCSRNG